MQESISINVVPNESPQLQHNAGSAYSLTQKNQLFGKLQQMVQKKMLSKQNVVDLHDILTGRNQSYSQNNNGTLYNSSKCSDETYTEIMHFIQFVEKTQKQQQQSNEPVIDSSPKYTPNSNLATPVYTIKGGEASKIVSNIVPIPMEMVDQGDLVPMDLESVERIEELEERFGQARVFKNANANFRFRYQKPEDVTKKNETFQKITKKTKKVASVPIHYQEKQITSFASPFNVYRKQYIPTSILFGDDEDEDDDGDENEDEDNNEEDNSQYEYDEDEDQDDENQEGDEDGDDGGAEDEDDEDDEDNEDNEDEDEGPPQGDDDE